MFAEQSMTGVQGVMSKRAKQTNTEEEVVKTNSDHVIFATHTHTHHSSVHGRWRRVQSREGAWPKFGEESRYRLLYERIIKQDTSWGVFTVRALHLHLIVEVTDDGGRSGLMVRLPITTNLQ